MTCQVYKDSAESAKQAVIHALQENEDLGTLSDLYNHYVGLREISDKHTHEDKIVITTNNAGDIFTNAPYDYANLSLGTDDSITFDTGDLAAAHGEIPWNTGNDHISFTTSDDVVTVPDPNSD
tara:strand:+ start:222 stop:590 length:369 start_codon:yes stop_codon:yes gene_type:complete